MKKAFDQTVRDLKRGVNKNVLKVPKVEQKILDATSNEPWGPHGSLLADIAQASRNYHEYQMIMSVIWKRINDTGKNWRHVYKALTVLDYLVAHGSERVIDDIREHSYQIGTLSDFQYIDSSGRDQGQNVRRKSQSLVSLVNNKERIQEVREKAAANREKYRTSFSTGGGNRPGSGGYGDRYDDDRYSDNNGYGREREREWNGGSRDDDKNGRNGSDGYSRDGDRDRYGRESDENYEGRYSNYREDDYRTSRGGSDGGYGPTRNRNSFDRERDRAYDDDDRHSSRSAGGNRADESSHDDRRLEHKLSESAAAVPPNYEEATRDSPIPSHEESKPAAAVLEAGSPSETLPRSNSSVEPTPVQQPPAAVPVPDTTQASRAADGFDEFDPRNAFTASPPAPAATIPPANNLEMDFFGSEEIGPLALVSMTTTTTTDEHPISTNSGFEDNSFMGMPHDFSSGFGQGGGNPFGDAVFKATPDNTTSTALVPQQANMAPPTAAKLEEAPSFNFGDALRDLSFSQPPPNGGVQDNSFAGSTPFMANQFAPAPLAAGGVVQQQTNQFTSTQAPNPYFVAPTQPSYPVPQPQSVPATFNQTSFPQSQPPATFNQTSFQQTQPPATFNQTSFQQSQPPATFNQTSFQQSQPPATFNQTPFTQSQPQSVPAPFNQSSFQQQTQTASNTFNQTSSAVNFVNQSPLFSLETTATPAVKPQTQTQPAKKFETKSSVWTDTLNRGLVNLNISGPTINPHADLGIDFDSMNRKERREEKKSIAPAVVSTTMMGKAMGGGSRSNATSMAPPRNIPGTGMGGMGGMGGMASAGMGGMAGPGMGRMAGAGTNVGYGMGGMAGAGTNVGYGMGAGAGPGMGGMNMGMNQQVGMGGMGTGAGMGMGYNGMGMGQQMNMRPMGGMPQAGPGAPGIGYNPGTGYGAQQPYGGGYR